jgi:hypothetical protein
MRAKTFEVFLRSHLPRLEAAGHERPFHRRQA